MTMLLANVILNSSTGLAKDRVVNTFHIDTTGTPATVAAAWALNLTSFYKDVHSPGTLAIGAYLSGDLSRAAAAHSMKFYDLGDPKPRAPIYEYVWQLASLSGSGANLPKEVAACLSYRTVPTSGIPPARQRGRLFIGPLNTNVLSGASTVNPTLDSGFINALKGGASYLVGLGTPASGRWMVYSRALGGIGYLVTNGWVDNAFDTQRRRGLAPTARNNW